MIGLERFYPYTAFLRCSTMSSVFSVQIQPAPIPSEDLVRLAYDSQSFSFLHKSAVNLSNRLYSFSSNIFTSS